MTLRGYGLALSPFAASRLDGSRSPVSGRDSPSRRSVRLIASDFHVQHFPGDGGLAPWELRREARRRELDVIVVTNHSQRLAALAATGLRRARSSRIR